jgi:hypothetical protein
LKISELIKQLQTVLEHEGDLDVGYHNQEFCTYEFLDNISVREPKKTGNYYERDDEQLQEKFVALR